MCFVVASHDSSLRPCTFPDTFLFFTGKKNFRENFCVGFFQDLFLCQDIWFRNLVCGGESARFLIDSVSQSQCRFNKKKERAEMPNMGAHHSTQATLMSCAPVAAPLNRNTFCFTVEMTDQCGAVRLQSHLKFPWHGFGAKSKFKELYSWYELCTTV